MTVNNRVSLNQGKIIITNKRKYGSGISTSQVKNKSHVGHFPPQISNQHHLQLYKPSIKTASVLSHNDGSLVNSLKNMKINSSSKSKNIKLKI